MSKAMIEAPMEEYEKCGFLIKQENDGSIFLESTEKQSQDLAIHCTLNLSIWGPKGNFIIDPDEDGLLIHIPILGPQKFQKINDPNTRTNLTHGQWYVDVFFAINAQDSQVTTNTLDTNFSITKKNNNTLVIQRKFIHKLYSYRWPYQIEIYPDSKLRIKLKKPFFRFLLR